MASKQLLMLPNAPLDISPDPAFETASESFICLYGPDTVITSPDITVSSIRITEVTDTMIGQFKPEISSMNTFRIDYDYAHGTKVQAYDLQHQEATRRTEKHKAWHERKKSKLRDLNAKQQARCAGRTDEAFVCIHGPDRVITSANVTISNIKVTKEERRFFRGGRRLMVDFQAPKGMKAEVYDCQACSITRRDGSLRPPRHQYSSRGGPDGIHHFKGWTDSTVDIFDDMHKSFDDLHRTFDNIADTIKRMHKEFQAMMLILIIMHIAILFRMGAWVTNAQGK